MVNVKFNSEGTECAAFRLGYPEPSVRNLRIKRNLENNPRCKATDIAKNVYVSPRAAAKYLHKQGNNGCAERKKTLLRLTNIKHF